MSTQNHQICSTALPSPLYTPHCPTNPTFPQKPIPSNTVSNRQNEHLKSSNRQHIPYSFLCTHTTLPCKFPNPPKPKPTQKRFHEANEHPKSSNRQQDIATLSSCFFFLSFHTSCFPPTMQVSIPDLLEAGSPSWLLLADLPPHHPCVQSVLASLQ